MYANWTAGHFQPPYAATGIVPSLGMVTERKEIP